MRRRDRRRPGIWNGIAVIIRDRPNPDADACHGAI